MKILFLYPYPCGESPSQRFRFEQYIELLRRKGFQVKGQAFWILNAWEILYKPNYTFRKVNGLIIGFLKRILILFYVPRSKIVFVHRECTPIGPPIIEWIIGRIFKKKIIYDFDDSIWLPNTSPDNKIISIIKWHSKFNSICKWSYKLSCGNYYLGEFAKQFNFNVIINPTTIDTEFLHNQALYKFHKAKENIITIGWTGSHSTLKYLEAFVPVIQRLESQFKNIRFLVIADRKPSLQLKSMVFLPWNKKNEIEDLLQFDIGVTPLLEDAWSQGKCGFKTLQYMALGIPALASPVGVNTQIIDHGTNGFFCHSEEDWFIYLSSLILDPDLRAQMGIEGRKKVVSTYSVSSNSSNFLSLFE